MGFRENLKSELSYSGMLVKELAARSGVKKQTLDNYLSVRNMMPSAEAAVKIARALGVTVEFLVTGEEKRHGKVSPDPEIQALVRNYKLLSEEDRKMVTAVMNLYKNRRNS